MEKIKIIAEELTLNQQRVEIVIQMFAEGNTVPFIARYRKERTGTLDEVQLRSIRDRYDYLTELEERQQTILKTIEEQGKLTDQLQQNILSTTSKQLLEDLYLPYKKKRKTRATIARELGLEPLAELIRNQEDIQAWLAQYLKQDEVEIDESKALQGAEDIVAEWIAEEATIKEKIRNLSWLQGNIKTEARSEFAQKKTKFELYYNYTEPLKSIPAHRYLAVRRGEEEGVLKLKIELPKEAIINLLTKELVSPAKGFATNLQSAIHESYQRLLSTSIEVELRMRLKVAADEDSINIFSQNIRELLLAPLGGTRMVLGIDPGFRTGSKWVVVDQTGKFLDKGVIYPVAASAQKMAEAEVIMAQELTKYHFDVICIGNGTASREVMQFIRVLLKKLKKTDVQPVFVNESGASIYSASDLAREEFPDLDLTFRGAISIARRFQDPLAELVKIDPKSIGVGQYQHDVNQTKLKRSLDDVVESCVNFVGVNLNTASPSLLSYVSGLNSTLAKNIVSFRNSNGEFKERKELLKVPRFGPKCFEQAAGFMRIIGGNNPLDCSAVHPENYAVVKKMATDLELSLKELVGNGQALDSLNLKSYLTGQTGYETLKDIIAELKKPGRDPRKGFVAARLDDNIQNIDDLSAGMELEGTVTNLTKFGAFVDLGVHQDGLVHLSEMSNRFIKEPSEVCSVGQVIKVTVLSVDVERKRISLSMKNRGVKGKLPPQKNSKSTKTDLASLADKFKSL
jgi:uncharacterized protein